ncbi:acetylpolyamine aminohydrolase domain protein [Burkholderia mallei]|nr:acetylpolyamine aminohydrolase domain protein [Burkholderia mallei]
MRCASCGASRPMRSCCRLGSTSIATIRNRRWRWTTDGFGRLGHLIGALRLPTVIVQEGGYRIESLEANARSFFGGSGALRG